MKTKYFVLASAVAIVTSLMLLKNCDNKNNTISKNKVPEAYIDAPFDVQMPRTIFDVDASEGAVLKKEKTSENYEITNMMVLSAAMHGFFHQIFKFSLLSY